MQFQKGSNLADAPVQEDEEILNGSKDEEEDSLHLQLDDSEELTTDDQRVKPSDFDDMVSISSYAEFVLHCFTLFHVFGLFLFISLQDYP